MIFAVITLALLALNGNAEAATCADPGIVACSAAPASNQRVRKEIKDLSTTEWLKVVDAIWTMKNTSMADGLSKYGNNFKTYDYFVVQHAVTAMDSRGDQGHFSNAFATFHAAFVLEFEVSLLAVDPSIGGLPYWDGTGDILTTTFFGSATGTGADMIVVDGKFPNFPIVSNFGIAAWSSYMHVVDGATNGYTGNGGFLRGTIPNNALQTSKVTRYGKSWSFATSAQDQCAATSGCWNDWYSCIEGGSSSGNFHSGAHQTIGGTSGSYRGDFEDPTTSPNDPIFMFHHANVDRNRMKWMGANAGESSVYYGFSTKCTGPLTNRCPTGGISIGDVITSQWPFTSTSLGLSGLTSDAITHADILCHVGPTTAPYSYAEPSRSTEATTTVAGVSAEVSSAAALTTTVASGSAEGSTLSDRPVTASGAKRAAGAIAFILGYMSATF